MLYRAGKYIKVFTLMLGWFIITAHLVIPHDHHSSDLYGNKEESCPVSDEKPGHGHRLPIHCHAFNDLVTEKAVKIVSVRYIQSGNILYPGICDICYSQVFITTITENKLTFTFNPLLENCSLRAPPARG
jgi:hypothetical protein